MSPIRRFVLVATVATGAVFWASLLLGSPDRRFYPLVGLIAAVLSAPVPRGPRIADYLLGRVLLAGCMSLGTLSFIAIGWGNITGSIGISTAEPWPSSRCCGWARSAPSASS